MFNTIVNLIRLRPLPISAYGWPVWQSAVLVTLMGVGMGLTDSETAQWVPSPVWAAAFSVAVAWVALPVIVGFMRWWTTRGGRWNGDGRMLNIIAAAGSVGFLQFPLLLLGAPEPLVILPLGLFSIWIGSNAIKNACGVSLGYAVGGVVLSFVPGMIATMTAILVIGGMLGIAGIVTIPEGVAP